MLEDDPSRSDIAEGPVEAWVEPDAPTVDQPAGVPSLMMIARAQARLCGSESDPVVVGRYRITRHLGEGAMGTVFAGYDDGLAREVAIKVLHGRSSASDESRQRLVREAQAMARLKHPNAAHVYEVGEHEGRVYLAMELVDGRTLRQWHRERERSPSEIVDMHLQAARGLAAAHDNGLVHRDYKPDNVMVDDRERARVMDFGLARQRPEVQITAAEAAVPLTDASSSSSSGRIASPAWADATATGTVVGTPAYMAPEQMSGGRVDPRADQFAFCVALFEALHGHRPFGGTTIDAVLAAVARREFRSGPAPRGVGRRLDAVVRRGLAFDPTSRFASMHELIAALEPFGTRARAPGAWRRPLVWIAGAAGVGVLAWSIQRPSESAAAPTPADAPTVAASAPPTDPWSPIVDASALPPTIDTPAPDDPSHMTVHRLENGLTVYLAPQADVSSIEIAIVVRADATDEREGQHGATSMLQWMMGQSDRIGSADPEAEAPLLAREHAAMVALDEAADPRAREAALANALAARDARAAQSIAGDYGQLANDLGFGSPSQESGPGIVWSQTVPRNRLAPWAKMTADALRRPALREFLPSAIAEVENRRSIAEDALLVAVERALREDTGRVLDSVTIGQSVLEFPYVGTRAVAETYYVPNNIALVMVGDVSPTETLPVLEAELADWVPRELPPRPVPGATIRGRADVIDDGPAVVVRAWPRRDGVQPTDALELFLAHSDFARTWLDADGRGELVTESADPWVWQIAVAPREGRSLDDAEAALADLLAALSGGEIAPDVIARAQAQAELETAALSGQGYGLALFVGESFARRTAWHDHLARARGDGLDRAAIARGARALIEAGGVVVRRTSGPPAEQALPPSPRLSPRPPGPAPPSAFARELLAVPASKLEPQFLIAGHSFTEHARGEGRVIAVEHDVAILELRWILPRGVGDDPWICDAWRSQRRTLQTLADPLGARVRITCDVMHTMLHIETTARRKDELWPLLSAVAVPSLDDEGARAHLADMLPARSRLRERSLLREEAFATYVLRGDRSLDAHLPDDAAVRRADVGVLRAALGRSVTAAPDVLVVGRDADAFATELVRRFPIDADLPGRRPMLTPPRTLDRTTVFAMHEPGRERAAVFTALVVPSRAAETRLGLDVFFHVPSPRLPQASAGYSAFSSARPPSYGGRALLGSAGVDCAPPDVPMLAAAIVAQVRARPSIDQLTEARASYERELRARRRRGIIAALDIWEWPAVSDGTADPALDEWRLLTGLEPARLLALHEQVAAAPIGVSVLADLDTIDLDALRAIGPVVMVDVDELRDPALTDAGMFGFEAE